MGIVTFLYCLVCIFMILYNYKKFNKLLISINIYFMIWITMIVLYALKLIKYYDLSVQTWLVIFLATILVFAGYQFGTRIKIRGVSKKSNITEKSLKKSLYGTSAIAMIAIIPNTFFLMQRYGINILSKTTQIYYDNIAGVAPMSIPYLSAFAQVSCVFAGMYFISYGFKWFLGLPVLLAMISILPSGSRGGLILTVFFIIMPIILMMKKSQINFKKEKKKIIFIVIVVLMLFVVLTVNRSSQLDPEIYKYISPTMLPVAYASPAVFKLYQYFASPIGVLNAFIEKPEFYFGGNSFGVLYNFLNKAGMNFQYSRYQKFYNIPIQTNVGTWLRELMQDFSVVGMFIVVFIFCAFVGYYEKRALIYKQKEDLLLASVLDTIFVMSFFVWYFREGTMMVIVLTCIAFRVLKFKIRFGFHSKKLLSVSLE